MAHDKQGIDRRGDRLPDPELQDHSRTDPAGLRVKVESKDEQQKLVEAEPSKIKNSNSKVLQVLSKRQRQALRMLDF